MCLHLEEGMTDTAPYKKHLPNSQTLVTTPAARRSGFVSAVLEKNRLADPFVALAQTLKIKAAQAKTPRDLLLIEDIQAGMLTAAGVSDKALNHLTTDDKKEILVKYVENVLVPAGDKFVEELVYRYLLTRGDTLGGQIRNLVGSWAQRRLSEFVGSALQLAGKPFSLMINRPQQLWYPSDALVALDYERVRAIAWDGVYESRVLAYNMNVPIIQTEINASLEAASADETENETKKGYKNVDICLLNGKPERVFPKSKKISIIKDSSTYIALGELKGGIDPAGADEHWKTANSALDRIRRSFAMLGQTPALFFIGNAIENSMANEIWNQLADGRLANAANMTDENQIVSLVDWLISL